MYRLCVLSWRAAAPRPWPASAARPQRGASLVEVLVAILLLTFALLGIAGLMASTVRFELGVESRSMMTHLFNDAANRLRANPSEIPGSLITGGASTYQYSGTWQTQQGTIAAPNPNCASAPCNTAQRASYDLWEMRTAARRNLPSGSLLLSGNSNNGLLLTYLWMDKDSRSGTPPVLQQSRICTANDTSAQLRTCCPAAANVGSTPGVRCLNLAFVP